MNDEFTFWNFVRLAFILGLAIIGGYVWGERGAEISCCKSKGGVWVDSGCVDKMPNEVKVK